MAVRRGSTLWSAGSDKMCNRRIPSSCISTQQWICVLQSCVVRVKWTFFTKAPRLWLFPAQWRLKQPCIIGFLRQTSCFERRGPANEWYDAVCVLLRPSKSARLWFAKSCLFNQMDRFSEYLLECPSAEVRRLRRAGLESAKCPSKNDYFTTTTTSTITGNQHLLQQYLRITTTTTTTTTATYTITITPRYTITTTTIKNTITGDQHLHQRYPRITTTTTATYTITTTATYIITTTATYIITTTATYIITTTATYIITTTAAYIITTAVTYTITTTSITGDQHLHQQYPRITTTTITAIYTITTNSNINNAFTTNANHNNDDVSNNNNSAITIFTITQLCWHCCVTGFVWRSSWLLGVPSCTRVMITTLSGVLFFLLGAECVREDPGIPRPLLPSGRPMLSLPRRNRSSRDSQRSAVFNTTLSLLPPPPSRLPALFLSTFCGRIYKGFALGWRRREVMEIISDIYCSASCYCCEICQIYFYKSHSMCNTRKNVW